MLSVVCEPNSIFHRCLHSSRAQCAPKNGNEEYISNVNGKSTANDNDVDDDTNNKTMKIELYFRSLYAN